MIKMYRQLDLNSYQLEPAQCKRCGSYNVIRNGRYRGTRKRVYKCKRCNCGFVYNHSDLERMRFHSKVIAFAVELYTTTGISLRTLARKMCEYFGIRASYEAIRMWIQRAAKHTYIPRLHKLNARFWCVDETMIRVNGKYVWLWVVLDPKIKWLLHGI
jgi:transposase-like protein